MIAVLDLMIINIIISLVFEIPYLISYISTSLALQIIFFFNFEYGAWPNGDFLVQERGLVDNKT